MLSIISFMIVIIILLKIRTKQYKTVNQSFIILNYAIQKLQSKTNNNYIFQIKSSFEFILLLFYFKLAKTLCDK